MGETRQIGLAFLGAGALAGAIGFFFFLRTRRFLRAAAKTQGTVTELVVRSGGEGGVVYSPVVQFTTLEGQPGIFTSQLGSSPPRHQVGDTVPVRYLPGKPESGRIATGFSLWFVPVLLGGLGAIFLVAGGVLAFTGSTSTIASSPGPGTSTLLNVQESTGALRQVNGTCAAFDVRKGEKVREVQLTFEGGSLTFIAKPYKGPGAYQPGMNLTVESTVFGGAGSVGGAIFINSTEKAGTVNLSAGQSFVSGSWDCSTVS